MKNMDQYFDVRLRYILMLSTDKTFEVEYSQGLEKKQIWMTVKAPPPPPPLIFLPGKMC